MLNISVVILCGGKGERLQKVISDRPKPLAEIGGRPFLDILVDYVSGFGFRRYILCTGYMKEAIESYYSRKKSSCEIILSEENVPLDTAGAIKNAEKYIQSDPFLVLNGDSFCPLDISQLLCFHRGKGALLSIALTEIDNKDDFGQITLDSYDRIIGFKEKIGGDNKNFVNAGVYCFTKEILSLIPPETKYSLEYDLFPKLNKEGFYGFVTNEKLIDIGVPERYRHAEKLLGKYINR